MQEALTAEKNKMNIKWSRIYTANQTNGNQPPNSEMKLHTHSLASPPITPTETKQTTTHPTKGTHTRRRTGEKPAKNQSRGAAKRNQCTSSPLLTENRQGPLDSRTRASKLLHTHPYLTKTKNWIQTPLVIEAHRNIHSF